jgi:hypothetical protein
MHLLVFLYKPTSAQLRRCSAIQFYLLHRHVSVTLVTIIKVSYSKNTSDKLHIMREENHWNQLTRILEDLSHKFYVITKVLLVSLL